MIFLLKRFISQVLLTFNFIAIVLIIGLFFKKYTVYTIIGILIILCISGLLGEILLAKLTRQYPQFNGDNLIANKYLISVFGSGFEYDKNYVPETWLMDNLIIRLTEAGRVAEILSAKGVDFQIAVSIPEFPELESEKLLALNHFFKRYGVKPEQIIVLSEAKDSRSEMKLFSNINQNLILVSNHWHIPRLMSLATGSKINAIAAGAGQLFKNPPLKRYFTLLPTAYQLNNFECAIHELTGILVIKIKKIFTLFH